MFIHSFLHFVWCASTPRISMSRGLWRAKRTNIQWTQTNRRCSPIFSTMERMNFILHRQHILCTYPYLPLPLRHCCEFASPSQHVSMHWPWLMKYYDTYVRTVYTRVDIVIHWIKIIPCGRRVSALFILSPPLIQHHDNVVEECEATLYWHYKVLHAHINTTCRGENGQNSEDNKFIEYLVIDLASLCVFHSENLQRIWGREWKSLDLTLYHTRI